MKRTLILFFSSCFFTTSSIKAQQLFLVEGENWVEFVLNHGVSAEQAKPYGLSKKRAYVLMPISKEEKPDVICYGFKSYLELEAKNHHVSLERLLQANPYLKDRKDYVIKKNDYVYFPDGHKSLVMIESSNTIPSGKTSTTTTNVSSTSNNASRSSHSITLVETGISSNKDEATKIALRSALEEAYGTFVSSNTTIVNDNITRDEIVSISTGNIQSYKELSCNKIGNDYHVQVQATVSIGKLIEYAQSKGASAELAGATFAMNEKIKQLNKENERKAMNHLKQELILFEKNNHLYDYSIEVAEPVKYGDKYYVCSTVKCTPNKNFDTFYDILRNGLNALGAREKDDENKYVHQFKYDYYHDLDRFLYFRNDYNGPGNYSGLIYTFYLGYINALKFQIKDNIGTEVHTYAVYNPSDKTRSKFQGYDLSSPGDGLNTIEGYGRLRFYISGAKPIQYEKSYDGGIRPNTGSRIGPQQFGTLYTSKKPIEFKLSTAYSLEDLGRIQKIDVTPVNGVQIYNAKEDQLVKSDKGTF